ncbi:MAG: hypothetical protein RL660_1860 [Bacteroidota bacterium]|jgi:amino acid transporter
MGKIGDMIEPIVLSFIALALLFMFEGLQGVCTWLETFCAMCLALSIVAICQPLLFRYKDEDKRKSVKTFKEFAVCGLTLLLLKLFLFSSEPNTIIKVLLPTFFTTFFLTVSYSNYIARRK